jgi:TolA-binding protein
VLDLARALTAMGKKTDACQTLAELGRRYPKAPTAVASGARSLRRQAACE